MTPRPILYNKHDCPSSARAREFLARSGVEFDNRLVDSTPVDRPGTLALARGARRLLAKLGSETVRLDAGGGALSEGDVARCLVHEDGFLRVPVLVVDDLLVRGFTEDLYREALGGAKGAS